jgi:hypothetical protein
MIFPRHVVIIIPYHITVVPAILQSNTIYAITPPKGKSTSDRTVPDILFGKKWFGEPLFSKKIKKYHAAAGETGVWS